MYGSGRREVDGSTVVLPCSRANCWQRIDLAQVVDTSIGLRGGTGFHEVRNRDGGSKPMMHNNHNFNQGEPALRMFLFVFILSFSRSSDVDYAGLVYLIVQFVTVIAGQPLTPDDSASGCQRALKGSGVWPAKNVGETLR